MADNVDITAGTGTTVATEDEAGVHYQVIKLVASGSGTTEALSKAEDSAHASGNHGIMALTVRQDTAAALSGTDADYQPLITDAAGRLHVLDQNSAAMLTALQLIDDTIYVDDADWSDGSSKHILVGGLYQSSPQSITDGDVGPFQVDVNGCIVLGTGAKAIGKLAANTGVDIGDVDVTSIVPGVAATNLGKAEDAVHSSGDVGVMALAVRDDAPSAATAAVGDYTPLLTNATGHLYVIDPTGNALITTGNASLATIAGDTTNIETAIQIIDDWDATHASAAPADGAQVMGAAYSTALPTDVGADADAARLVTDRYGRLCTGLQPQAAKAVVNNADTTTAREIVAAAATRRIFVTSLIISVDTAGNYWLEDGDATAVTGKFYLAANGGCAITFPEGTPLNTVTQNKALNVKGSTAGNVGVTVTYYLAV